MGAPVVLISGNADHDSGEMGDFPRHVSTPLRPGVSTRVWLGGWPCETSLESGISHKWKCNGPIGDLHKRLGPWHGFGIRPDVVYKKTLGILLNNHTAPNNLPSPPR